MAIIDDLNSLAEDTPDSKNTVPGGILFFRDTSTAGESLKKLKNHNFKIGYAFNLTIDGKEYTRIVAYNRKNDIFRGWMQTKKEDGKIVRTFPFETCGFHWQLNMPRINGGGRLVLFKEGVEKVARKTSDAKKNFSDLPHLEQITDWNLYGEYWPVLENPDVEKFRHKHGIDSPDSMIYSDVAGLCNIYKFLETYELLDDGLKAIYKCLYDNVEQKFCAEISDNNEIQVVAKTLEYLNLSLEDLEALYRKHNCQPEPSQELPVKHVKFFDRVIQMLGDKYLLVNKEIVKRIKM